MLNRKSLEKILNKGDSVLLGVVDLKEDLGSYQHYLKWLEDEKHAGMDYMENHKDLRLDPQKLMPGSRSCLVLAYNYNLGDKLSDLKEGPKIAQYARLKDYHKFLRKQGKALAEQLKVLKPDLEYRVLVDSAPLFEKAMAAKTSKGFLGKNTLFIHPTLGSYYFLFEILLNCELSVDSKVAVNPKERSAELGGCGSCRRCSSFCPTGALDKEYTIDARKCLSYYTIEHRGTIPLEYWPFLEKYLYGCDICQMVCPYNREAKISKTPFVALKETPDLYDVATMDQIFYEKTFGGTPMTRAKRQGLQRNALIAMTVMKDARLNDAMAHVRESNPHPLLQDTLEQIVKNR